MSEELRNGIPKAIPTGRKIIFTKEEMEETEKIFEDILKKEGVLKADESIKDMKQL